MTSACILSFALVAMIGAAGCAAQTYRPAGAVPLGAPDRRDYVVHDPASGRVYVAHARLFLGCVNSEMIVLDARAGTLQLLMFDPVD